MIEGQELVGACSPTHFNANPAEVARMSAIFFSDSEDAVTAAKQICSTCPVRQSCLDIAVSNREEHGTWGGKTPTERRNIT